MKYFRTDTAIDETVKEIRRKIRLSMNGVVADTMKERGLTNYKQNFGVQIPRLKEIASIYTPSHDLAQRLWALKIRETMILATILQPIESFLEKNGKEWLNDIDNIELVEQTCMNLFSKLRFAKAWSETLIVSDEEWAQIVGFTIILRLREKFNAQETKQIVKRAVVLLHTENYRLYRTISVCLARLSRNSKEISIHILEEIIQNNRQDKIGFRYAQSEIEQEISFLDF
ncbi:MAG: DNA alkylation repair protein [Paludibacteraceae bacterium]